MFRRAPNLACSTLVAFLSRRIITMNAVESAVEPSSSHDPLLTRAILDLFGLTLLTTTLMVALGT